jgi:hypothetical protein
MDFDHLTSAISIIVTLIVSVSLFMFKYYFIKKDAFDRERYETILKSIEQLCTKNNDDHARLEKTFLEHSHVAHCVARDCNIDVTDLTLRRG